MAHGPAVPVTLQPAEAPREVLDAALRLLDGPGSGESAPEVVPLAGGANNRVFRLRSAGGTYLLKWYFRHPHDPRDRFAAEQAFYAFAWEHGVRAIPRPVARDAAARVGLFAFVPGRKLRADEVAAAAVDQALALFLELNRFRGTPAALALPAASEACFTFAEHLACVDRRVARLRTLEPRTEADGRARRLVEEELAPTWARVRGDALRAAERAGVDVDRSLAAGERCLSPSDFGFHNALLAEDGKLRFFDFEYAGWDDPAKMVCDFFCQPQVPVPIGFWDRFLEGVAPAFEGAEELRARSAALLPVYRVKWCCIVLNEFLRVDSERRAFSAAAGDPEEAKQGQIEKARRLLAVVREHRAEAGLSTSDPNG